MFTRGQSGICSSDESDHDGATDKRGNSRDRTFRIDKHWRTPEFVAWLHSLDPLVASMREPPVGARMMSGTLPRERIKTRKVNHASIAPPGLPINAYKQVSSSTQSLDKGDLTAVDRPF